MTDDVKAAVEWLRLAVFQPPVHQAIKFGLIRDWIQGEPARTAAAVAAAREEQRLLDVAASIAGTTSLDAYRRAAEERIAELEAAGAAAANIAREFDRRNEESKARAEKAEAERDALRAQVEAARAACERLRLDASHTSAVDIAREVAATGVLAAMDGAKP